MDKNNQRTVLVIIGSLLVGGTERHLSLILPKLVQRGFVPSVFLLGSRGPMAEPIETADIIIWDGVHGSQIFRYLPRYLRGFVILICGVLQVWRHIRRHRPSICHAYLPFACIIGGLATKFARHRCFIVSRRSLNYYQRANPLLSRIERWLMSSARAALGNSHAVVEELKQEGVSAARCASDPHRELRPNDRIRRARRRHEG